MNLLVSMSTLDMDLLDNTFLQEDSTIQGHRHPGAGSHPMLRTQSIHQLRTQCIHQLRFRTLETIHPHRHLSSTDKTTNLRVTRVKVTLHTNPRMEGTVAMDLVIVTEPKDQGMLRLRHPNQILIPILGKKWSFLTEIPMTNLKSFLM